ncbi:P-loop NTPase fold protein [Terrabacter sp. 2YAF2]|uniref:P-loop NTPase fold protein n=1 Tax=Terrabacter sp. 2YAF2 TaxID=3233026 RepID=UPI003F97F137
MGLNKAREDLAARYEALRVSPEFSQFGEHWKQVCSFASKRDLATYVERLHRAHEKLENITKEEERVAGSPKSRLRSFTTNGNYFVAVGLLGLAVVVLSEWVLGRGWAPEWSWLHASWGKPVFVISLGLMVVLLIVRAPYVARDEDGTRQKFAAQRLKTENDWQNEAEVFASESIRRSINQLLGPRGLVPFPTAAPDLVELAAENIVDSKTIAFVKKFISEHTTSAIGIAGPRGSGKSTLMLAISQLEGTRAISVLAASKYDPMDLLRRVAFAAASPDGSDVDALYEATVEYRYRRRLRMLRVVLAELLIFAGLGLILADILEPPFLKLFGPVSLLGALAILAAVALLLGSASRGSAGRRPSGDSRAYQLVSDLAAEYTENRGAKVGLQLTSLFGVEGTRSYQHKRRDLTYGDLVDRLRQVLPSLLDDASSMKRLVVVIDELDKLPDVASLTNVVNAIKDLFHIPGVHFLVSVSDEALASFALRGLQPRDAFDSSFDEIVEMARLTPLESRSVLESRVAGFPEPLGVFCSVWAGGLPRDLIRAARGCIEISTSGSKIQPWSVIGKAFLERDLSRRSGAYQASAALLAEQGLGAGAVIGESFQASGESGSAIDIFTACCKEALERVATSDFKEGENLKRLEQLSDAVAAIGSGPHGLAKARQLLGMTFTVPSQQVQDI